MNLHKTSHVVVGVMSGTSLDGLDLAICELTNIDHTYGYRIIRAKTLPYSPLWRKNLEQAHSLSANKLSLLHNAFGEFIAKNIMQFIKETRVNPDLIASHGHTVFHQPEKNHTLQIGNGAIIAAQCRIPTVCDFRSTNIALQGQGAPLVPLADKLLFHDYEACINLGGFSNISIHRKKIIAYDISPVNSLLNKIALEKNKKFDKNGTIASKGKIHTELLDRLNRLSYYSVKGAKSLSREWNENHVHPLLDKYPLKPEDKLRTLCEHIVFQIHHVCQRERIKGRILLSGGGTYNSFLISLLIKKKCSYQFIIPDPLTIEYKESLAFALLGLMRWEHKENVLREYTGASRDSISGAVYL